MSQYYQQPPIYPPEEDQVYYEDTEVEILDDKGRASPMQLGFAFLGGGCVVAILFGTCALLLLGSLFLIDPEAVAEPTTPEGMDIGLELEAPAYPDEAVVNEQLMQLRLLEVNRNASLADVSPVEGTELIIVTIELVNLGEEDSTFNERDFFLVNAFEEAYDPVIGVVDGALGRGSLPSNEGLEGRLVFEVLEGEFDLTVLWDVGRESTPRYLYLE